VTRSLSPNHSRAMTLALSANHSRAITRSLTSSHPGALSAYWGGAGVAAGRA
jgi:hypothetical protein